MSKVNPILPHDYNFMEPRAPEPETTNDVCDHEHTWACTQGDGWNSGSFWPSFTPTIPRREIRQAPAAGFEPTE